MDKNGLSSVMATILMATITIAIAIPATYWMIGLTALFTQYEKIEIKGAYVTNVEGNYVITMQYENTGTRSTSIDHVELNSIPCSSFRPNVELGGDLGSLPSDTETGISKTGTLTFPAGATDPSGNKLVAGVPVFITFHTTGLKSYQTVVTLQGDGDLNSTAIESSSLGPTVSRTTQTSNRKSYRDAIEIKYANAVYGKGNYIVTLEYVNTGSTITYIDQILLNGVKYKNYMPVPTMGGSLSSLPSRCTKNSMKNGTIIVKQGATDLSGKKLTGIVLVTLHTIMGNTYNASVTLPNNSNNSTMPTSYTLTISYLGTGSGTANPLAGSYSYSSGSSMIVTATATMGSTFDHWTLNGAPYTQNPIGITMSQNQNLVAYFSSAAPPPQTNYTLTISYAGTGSGTTNPMVGSYSYTSGTTVTVTAIAAAGSTFGGWNLNGNPSSLNPITFTMTSDSTLVESFVANPVYYTLTISYSGTGSGTTNPIVGSYSYVSGSSVTVTATAASGSTFGGWTLNGASYMNPITVTMSSNTTLVATFTLNPAPTYTLTISYAGTGSGTTYPAAGSYSYSSDSVVTVTATNSGSTFDHWTVNGVSFTQNPISVSIDSNCGLVAYFTLNPPPTGTIFFSDDFESGTLSKWTYNGQIEAQAPYTYCLVDSTYTYGGKYAFHSKRVDTSSSNYHWVMIVKWGDDAGLYNGYRELYYGWMMYIPATMDSPYWQQLVEWMTQNENPMVIILALMMEQRTSAPGEPQILKLYSTATGSYKQLWADTRPLSYYLGRWVKVDFYMYQGVGDGIVKMWLDDQLVYQGTGLTLRVTTATWDHSVHLGLYAYDDPAADVWYDNFYIANYKR